MSSFQSNILDNLKQQINDINSWVIELGVFAGQKQRDDKGVTNAELMFIHENGSPLNNVPARPVLKMTIEHAQQTIVRPVVKRCVKYALRGEEDKIQVELDKLAIRLENYAREIIYSNDGRLAPNSARTAAKKGGNHPLFDTGQLSRSITCRAVNTRS